MCELFGFTSEYSKDLTPYLTEFFSHSTYHPNGWGIAKRNGNLIDIQTEPICANKSKIIGNVIDNLLPQNFLLAHIRKATVGKVNNENCHPFTRNDKNGRQWVLIHNGTIFSGMELITYMQKQNGNTDSERILLYIIDQINLAIDEKGYPLNQEERINVIEKVINTLSHRNKLNLLIYDGENFYVHTNMKDTLYYKNDNGTIFSTTPLDDGVWNNVPMCTLQVYQEGKLIYTGKSHNNEYVLSTEFISENSNFNL
jgi:glutamine amidotransferase